MPSYTEEDMLKAINLIQNGQSQVKAAKEASVPRSSLRDRLQGIGPTVPITTGNGPNTNFCGPCTFPFWIFRSLGQYKNIWSVPSLQLPRIPALIPCQRE
jgi:hypothetical protein